MFSRVSDFKSVWNREAEATLKVLRALTDASLTQAVRTGGRTLGRLAWHLVVTIPEMMGQTGLSFDGPPEDAPMPVNAGRLVQAYEDVALALATAIDSWTDDTLRVEDEMYGQRWQRGTTLFALVAHQIHHRGQMTVLLRQAGLPVPGLYGPAEEEWSQMGMAAPAV